MDKILSLKDQIKDYKINDNVQELSNEKSEDLILLRERVKYLESENKFLKDDIFNKQKLIDKSLENNNKLTIDLIMFLFSIFNVAKAVLYMEVALQMTGNTSR